MKQLLKIAIVFIAPILLLSCNNKKSMNGSHYKYSEGFHVADFIDFTKNASLQNDTIYINNAPRAIVEKFENRWFADNLLFIKNLKTGETGRYVEK